MPQMTGVRMADEIRNIRPDIPVILMSGFSDAITSENCQKFGIDDFVMKPIVSRDLSRAMRRVLDAEKEQVRSTHV